MKFKSFKEERELVIEYTIVCILLPHYNLFILFQIFKYIIKKEEIFN